jgi:thiosulfate dehydrogenase
MDRRDVLFLALIVVTVAAIGGALTFIFSKAIYFGEPDVVPLSLPMESSVNRTASAREAEFKPPSLADAPPDLRDVVMLGYNIMMNTQRYAGEYVGNELECRNCHFEAGMIKDTISLVGVAAKYPRYREREHYSIDLVDRTNNCFMRSMNGRPLPPDSEDMQALMAFYHWISRGIPIYSEVPWLGLKKISQGGYPPDESMGWKTYVAECAPCHGDNGQGTKIAPPIWGSGSFNDCAGMANLDTFASFIYHFMPMGNPNLSMDRSFDVAKFCTSQPRPHFSQEQ